MCSPHHQLFGQTSHLLLALSQLGIPHCSEKRGGASIPKPLAQMLVLLHIIVHMFRWKRRFWKVRQKKGRLPHLAIVRGSLEQNLMRLGIL